VAGEYVYDRPFQWGSKRTGPDLARVGGRYTDNWHYVHLMNPRDVVPQSNMPAFPWLAENELEPREVVSRMRTQKEWFDVPYSEEQLANAREKLEGKTEMEAVIAYLQGLGTAVGEGPRR
jgi:cytochrome c oxidase cbb3-type subunit 2